MTRLTFCLKNTPYLFIIFSLLLSFSSFAATPNISKDSLQASIDALTARQGLDTVSKEKLIKLYQSAQDNLANSARFKARTAEFKLAIKQAPLTSKKLQLSNEQLQNKAANPPLESFANISSEELTQRLILEKSNFSSVDDQRQKIDADLVAQSNRLGQIHDETLAVKKQIADVQNTLNAPPPSDASKQLNEAQAIYLKTLLAAHDDELNMLEAEAMSHPLRVELLKAQLQAATLDSSRLNALITNIETVLTNRREQEARAIKASFSQIEKDLKDKPAVIQDQTHQNMQYSRDLQAITRKIEDYNEQKSNIDAQMARIDSDFKSAEKKIALAGLSPALGQILREQRRDLLKQNAVNSIQDEIALTSLAQFKVDDALAPLSDVDGALKTLMSRYVGLDLPIEQRMMIQAELRILLSSQREILNKLTVTYNDYLRVLSDFDFAQQQLVEQNQKFALYLDEHLLWVLSSAALNAHSVREVYDASLWLLSPHNGVALLRDAVHLLEQKTLSVLFCALLLSLLVFCRYWATRYLKQTDTHTEKNYHNNPFSYTLKSLACHVMIAAPLPLLFYSAGWLLNSGINVATFSKAVASGLQSAALSLFFIQLFYDLFAPQGIVRKHFQWRDKNVALLHRQFAWLRFVSVPTIFLINATANSKIPAHSDSLGRLALLVSLIALAIFLSRLLHPDKGLLDDFLKHHPSGWLSMLRYVWYPVAILMPLIIIGFASVGYYLSALELQQKFIITLRLIFVLMIVYEMMMHWLTQVNRQLAISNAKQKRKVLAASEKPLAGSEDVNLPINEQLLDIPKINAQTMRLLNVTIGLSFLTGFWMIWKNILPAFAFLDNIVLWQHLVTHDNQEIYQPIVLTNVLVAGLYLFITVVSVRNFSGVMEVLVFRRLSIDVGSRYTVNQLAKYFLVTIGFISISNELGGSWAKVQWLVAALSVGLGFGLQEIFANLVSGIILLFERPIRVGDSITIGNVSGKVSRIQMRATTIIDWDQKELIVPNKTFITDQIVNWTLSDAITRIVIPLSIAYDSDVEAAHALILKTVQDTPLVLADPEPSVLFIGFGDSGLTFSIRIFVSELANRLPATHDLHVRLERALREHGIKIPFPQRDVHLHTV